MDTQQQVAEMIPALFLCNVHLMKKYKYYTITNILNNRQEYLSPICKQLLVM